MSHPHDVTAFLSCQEVAADAREGLRTADQAIHAALQTRRDTLTVLQAVQGRSTILRMTGWVDPTDPDPDQESRRPVTQVNLSPRAAAVFVEAEAVLQELLEVLDITIAAQHRHRDAATRDLRIAVVSPPFARVFAPDDTDDCPEPTTTTAPQ